MQDCRRRMLYGELCSTVGPGVYHRSEYVRVCVGEDVMVSLVGFSRVRWDEERTYTKGSAPRVSRKHTETHIDKAVSLIKRGTRGLQGNAT